MFPVIAFGALVMIAAMAFAWALIRKTGNGGLADVVWTFGLGLTALIYSLAPFTSGGVNAFQPHQTFAAFLAVLWTLRLGVPLWRRNVGGPEDARYTALRNEWGTKFQARFFGLLMAQAAAAIILALAIMLAARNPMPLGCMDILGLVVMAAALAGGYTADWQLAQFKKDTSRRGTICDVGLWGRSRHPNYFFEVIFWSGWPLIALSGGWAPGAIAFIAPALMYWLLRYVSGVPTVEPHMARHYGAAFEDYSRRVPPFFPRLFPR